MSIGLQAYLQGYMHEKTADIVTGADAGGPFIPAAYSAAYPGAAAPWTSSDEWLRTFNSKIYPNSWESSVPRSRQAARAEYIASPATEEDLYRRYGRVPESSLPGPLYDPDGDPGDLDYLNAPNVDYMRDVTDRITAQNRAATTGRLQASGRNKGRIGLGGVLRAGAEFEYQRAHSISNPARRTAGYLAPLLKRFGALGQGARVSGTDNARQSQRIKERVGEPLSQGKR
jgi:hypothetical protein